MKKILLALLFLLSIQIWAQRPLSQEHFEKYLDSLIFQNPHLQDIIKNNKNNRNQKNTTNAALRAFNQVDYKVLSVDQKKDTSKLKVRFKYLDLPTYLNKSETESFRACYLYSPKECNQKLIDKIHTILESETIIYKEKEIDINLILTEGVWFFAPSTEKNKSFYLSVPFGL